MIPDLKLVSNGDGTYNIHLEYNADVEFAKDFLGKGRSDRSQKLSASIRSYAQKAKIKSVKIFVTGVLIATVAFSSFLSIFAATDRYHMGYLQSGTDRQQVELVNQTNNALDTVSPNYFEIKEDGSLQINSISTYLINSMHEKGMKVVPFISNHWNRTAGINALKNVDKLSTQIANYVEQYNLDGVNVDLENLTSAQRDQYTEFVRLLREKIPSHKEISVAVAANPNGWETGWHGSYDYSALAQHADYLMIMAYDEHYEGGEAGPVASIDFVEKSIQYALSKTSSEKIVLGIPLYGRVWGVDNTQIAGKSIRSQTLQKIIKGCDAKVTYDQKSQSVKIEFEITQSSGDYTVGWNTVLSPGKYVAWYENDQSYQAKLQLVQKYNLKGTGTWALGQEDSSIWEHYESWANGEDEEQPKPPAQNNLIYTVQRGDSLWKIAEQYLGKGSRYPEIMKLNGLSNTTIHPGMQLKIPGNSENPSVTPPTPTYREYTVKRGDSLWKIASTQLGSGSRYPEIVKLNGLKNDTIYPGQVLKIPQ